VPAPEVPAPEVPQPAPHETAPVPGAAHEATHHETEEPPTFDDINWFYGLLGESSDAEPSLLYRPKGMPVPFLATLANWGILVWLIVLLARKQLPAYLAKRKAAIVQGMQDAKKLRDESAERLQNYEDKLAKIDSDIERIKQEMQKAGEQERDRILAEAVERRARMERDARRLIETEIEGIKESLRREVVQAALAAAKQSIQSQLAPADQQRLFDDAMASLNKLAPRSLGEQA
jgi:F-type H+-transporting ATPase subunit b